MSGKLYLVSTPIGNLQDLSPRVRDTFEKVNLILAEDTRITIKLLNHLGIKRRMLSCHEHNEFSRLKIITEAAHLNHDIALVCDAGTPLISDPGKGIVEQAINCGMTIVPIAGPNAGILALIASGLPCERYVFEGFLPQKKNLLEERLTKLQFEERTIIFYEAPHRLIKSLQAIYNAFGDRNVCLAKEISKLHEQFMRASLSTIISRLNEVKILGEYVIVLAGYDKQALADKSNNQEEMEALIRTMLAKKETVKNIVKTITEEFPKKRSEVYQLVLFLKKTSALDPEQDYN